MGTHGEIGSCIAPRVSKNLGGFEDPGSYGGCRDMTGFPVKGFLGILSGNFQKVPTPEPYTMSILPSSK